MSFEWGKLGETSYRSIVDSDARMNIWEGSVRSGKTIASILRWIEFVQKAPTGGVLMMVAKTSKTLHRNILSIIIDMVGPKNARFNRGTGAFYLYGKEIDTIGALDERSQEKIRGATIVGCYGDELSLWPESFFKMMLSRLSVKGAKLFGTTNPDSPYHWLKVDIIDRASELDLKVFHFVLDDNPTLDPEYVKSLKAEYTGLWRKRFIDGLWVQASGAIWDCFDEDLHTKDVSVVLDGGGRTRFRNYITSADYGTNNPFAIGLFGYDGKPPVYLVKEYYFDSVRRGKQKTDSEYADDYIKFIGDYHPSVNYIDPSAASFMAEMRKRGVNTTPAKNDVLDGVRFVSQMLEQGKFIIDKSCKETICEVTGYVWDAKAQQRGEDKPLKVHDHACDMIRYGLFSHFYRENHTIFGTNYR